MAESIEVENYKKNVKSALSRYEKKLAAAEGEITKCVAALKTLGVADPLQEIDALLKDKDKKKQSIAKKIVEARKSVDTAGLELKTELSVLTPPKNAPEKELQKLPAWVESAVKDATVKITKNLKVKLKVKIDYDKQWKLKELGLDFTWYF